jgi:hypothetical protein
MALYPFFMISFRSDCRYIRICFKLTHSPLDKIAKFDGTSWVQVGTNTTNYFSGAYLYEVKSDTLGNIYVFANWGGFSSTISKWNGSSWINFGSVGGFTDGFTQFEVTNSGGVYVTGIFSQIEGVQAANIAYFNGTVWSPLQNGIGTGEHCKMNLDSAGNLYVASQSTINGQSASLAKWNGSSWQILSTESINNYIRGMAIGDNGDVYIGGAFTQIGVSSHNFIAKYSGSSWTGLCGGMTGLRIHDLYFHNGILYAVGNFTMAGNINADNYAEWDGNQWSTKDGGVIYSPNPDFDQVDKVIIDGNGTIVVSGQIYTSNYQNIAKWAAPPIPAPVLVSLSGNEVKIKYHNSINPSTANATNLKIWGDETGQRTGTYTTSADTVIFTPATPFRAGELLHITSRSGLQFTGGNPTTPFSWVRQAAVSNPTTAVFDTIGTGIILPASAFGSNAGYQATMADVNRDGRQDLIYRYHIGGGATNIRVYIRNANGSFATPVTYTNTESYSTLIGTPDLNNDGYPDLVITHNVPARIQVRLNNGAGGFGAATLYVVNDYTSSANVYDLDRDGDLDIVVYSGNSDPSQNAINVLKNNGNGTFAAATTLTTGVAYSGGIPADFNNDGIFELLYTSDPYVTNNQVFRVYTNDGNANFTQYSTEPNPNVKSIRSAFDFDGNQSPDIITRNPNAEIHLANSGLTYTLNTPTVLDAQDSWMLAGDIDGDGDLDILSTNRHNGSNWNSLPMKLLLNDGYGNFTSVTSTFTLPNIWPVDLTDYDGDGDLDHIYLNTATGEIKVLLNNCSIVRTLTIDNSPLSGTYKAAEMIDIQGNVSVSPSDNVVLSAPLVKVSNLFNPGNLSNITISPDGCAEEDEETPFECGTSTVTFTYNGSSVTYGTVVSAGRCWLDRNLGASQVATSSTDAAAYGDLFQWGRGADGHQIRNPLSVTTSTLSSTDSPGHGLFITIGSGNVDWRSPQNNNLWQGVNGINNPCPSGFRLPIEGELNTERLSWSSNNSAGAFASPLKLPVAGLKLNSSGSLVNVGPFGYYWSSTVSSTGSRNLIFLSSDAFLSSGNRAVGRSVRCIKD